MKRHFSRRQRTHQDTLAERYEEARVAFAEAIAEPSSGVHRAHSVEGDDALRGFFAGFADRWTRVHRYALAGLSDAHGREDAERDFQREAKLLLRRRQALVSACAQALARYASEACGERSGAAAQDVQEARARVHAAIAAHDTRFEAIVQAELGRLRAELARAHEARRALGAYARTLQYRGE